MHCLSETAYSNHRTSKSLCVHAETLGGSMIAVSSLGKAMHEMVAQKGDFTLFALLRRDEPLYSFWVLVVSAPWLNSEKLAGTREVADHLEKSIGRKGLQQLARIVVITDDNPTIKFFLKNVPVDDGERRIQKTDLFGLQ